MASFANSFWPQPGPSGSTTFNVDRLWSKIDAGVVENQELLRFISVSLGGHPWLTERQRESIVMAGRWPPC